MELRHHLICAAPAKINLTLAVLGRRPDGFHDLESWVAPIDLSDRLCVAAADAPSIVVEAAGGVVPADETNLAWKAMASLAQAAGHNIDASIELQKRIPVGAGLAGGSSDAAATLLALNNLWELNWPRKRLAEIAASVGSDVSLFLFNSPAVLRGRGECVEPVVGGRPRWIVLVVPVFSLSTPDVYRRYAQLANGKRKRPEELWRVAGKLSARELSARLFNDLEAAAFDLEPRLAALHSTLCAAGDRPTRMTGSGSCLFTVFDEEDEARRWAEEMTDSSEHIEQIHVVRTLEVALDSAGG